MAERRAVITGLGAITPVGLDIATVWQNIISGNSGISRVDGINPDVKIFGIVSQFDPAKYMDRKEARRMDRFAQFAVAAAAEALKDSGIDSLVNDSPALREETGVIIGTGNGGQHSNEEQYANWKEKGPGKVSPFAVPMIMPNAASGNVALKYGLQGPANAVMSACATGLDSIIGAYDKIVLGKAKVMLTGGAEASLTPMVIAGFANMGALTRKYNDNPTAGSRPFDRDRDGFVFSEGAAVLVLEELEHALQRRARIYAEIAGYWQNNDAHHITSPNTQTQARAIRRALESAGIMREQVDYINAHGTSTPQNDASETAAIKIALGEHAYKVPISSTKSMTGHLAGAAGAIEAIICAKAIQTGIIPPTINLDNPDLEAGCDLDYVPNKAVRKPVTVAVKNSFGFGGHNAVIVLKAY